MATEITEYTSGLDWITASAFLEHGAEQQFRTFSQDLKSQLKRGTDVEVMEVKAGGYTGEKIGSWQFKHRALDNHRIIAVEGRDAETLFKMLIEQKILFRPTRLDGQLTGRHSTSHLDYAREISDTVREFRAKKKTRKRQTMAQFSGSSADTGVTIGSRTSSVYCRIYDWEAKHALATNHNLWRYEIEYKAEAAQRFADLLIRDGCTQDTITRAVTSRLAKYNILLDGVKDMEPAVINTTKTKGTTQSRLKHLEKSVIPFIEALWREGAVDEIKALFLKHGLTDADGILLNTAL